MADASLALVRNRTLEKLFVLIAGETADAEDAEIVERVIANTNEELRENELCYWSDSATPQYLVECLAAYYACFLANDYMDAAEARTFKEDRDTGVKACLAKIRELTATKLRVEQQTPSLHF